MPPKGPPMDKAQKAALGVKKPRKKRTPKALKPRAYWNLALEKSLVEILHDHNNDYYKAQNGWSGDTWNLMTKTFQERNKHVNYTKSQLQDKEKELKREYKMLKEARMQSGAGWCEETCMIQADEDLWANLLITFPRIGKFKKQHFPLFDSLGDLYDGQIAEGTYNFTSTSEPKEMDDEEYEDERGSEDVEKEIDDDVQILGAMGPTQRIDEANSVNQVDVGERVDNEQHAPKKAPKKLHPKKPNHRDEMVGVVDRYVRMKEKQAEDEKAEKQAEDEKAKSTVFSIAKCISALHKMKEFTPAERVKASKVFKTDENRETFLTWVAEDQELAIMWLRGELQELP